MAETPPPCRTFSTVLLVVLKIIGVLLLIAALRTAIDKVIQIGRGNASKRRHLHF